MFYNEAKLGKTNLLAHYRYLTVLHTPNSQVFHPKSYASVLSTSPDNRRIRSFYQRMGDGAIIQKHFKKGDIMRIERYIRNFENYEVHSLPEDMSLLPFGFGLEWDDHSILPYSSIRMELCEYLSVSWEENVFPYTKADRCFCSAYPNVQEEFREQYQRIIKGEIPNWRMAGFSLMSRRLLRLNYAYCGPRSAHTPCSLFLLLSDLESASLKFTVPACKKFPGEKYILHFNSDLQRTEIHEQIGCTRRSIRFEWGKQSELNGLGEALVEECMNI